MTIPISLFPVLMNRMKMMIIFTTGSTLIQMSFGGSLTRETYLNLTKRRLMIIQEMI